MGGRAELVRVGGAELLFEVEPVSGSQKVSKAGDAAKKVIDAFGEVEAAVGAMGDRVAAMAASLAESAGRPSELQVVFGLKVSASGSVVVAAAGAEAALTVTLTYPGVSGSVS